MQLGTTIRLCPSQEQAQEMWRYAGASRFAWNESLSFCEKVLDETHKMPSEKDCRHHLVELRETTHSWLNEIPECVTKKAISDLFRAYQKAFKNAKNKTIVSKKKTKDGKIINKYGFPRYKKRGRCQESFYQRTDAFRMVDRKHVKLTGIKTPVMVKFSKIPEHVVNPRIKFNCGHWYLSYTYETEPKQMNFEFDTLGIDLGVHDMAITSNGDFYDNPNHDKQARRLIKRIKCLQRRLSRKYEANKQGEKFVKTKNIVKLESKLAKLQRKLANYRQNARHQLTSDIDQSRHKMVVIEDLNTRGMMSNRKISRAVGEIGLFEVRRQLEYKSKLYGFELVIANRYFPSTQMCSSCGEKTGPKGFDGLKVREWTCPVCGEHHNRDINAAKNLAAAGSVCQRKSSWSVIPTRVGTPKSDAMNRASTEMSIAC